jgi:hypothetical protein
VREWGALGVSLETAKRDWKMARAWLYTQLADKQTGIKSSAL